MAAYGHNTNFDSASAFRSGKTLRQPSEQEMALKTAEEEAAKERFRELEEKNRQRRVQKAEAQRSDASKDADKEDVPSEEDKLPDEAQAGADEPDPTVSDAELEERLRLQREVEHHEEAELDAKRKELDAKIDKALAMERDTAKRQYAIENHKKNTLTRAVGVYGGKADLEAIQDSAEAAKAKTAPDVSGLSAVISLDIQNKLHHDEVIVRTADGGFRVMDRDVAEALRMYTNKGRNASRSIMDVLAHGRNDDSLTEEMESYPEFEAQQVGAGTEDTEYFLDRHEEEKLEALRNSIMENDRRERQFEQLTPDGLEEEEYQSIAERRFAKYGYPSGLTYIMTTDYVYVYNGRSLPSAMSSQSIIQAEREEYVDKTMVPSY